MKTIKRFAGLLLLLALGMCLYSCIGPVPVDVVMIDNELYFVLEEERNIAAIQVAVFNAGKKIQDGETMWALNHDLGTEVKKRKYPNLKQIKYGQILDEFPRVIGPAPLKRNVEYWVGMNMGDRFAGEVFIIKDDNKVVMPRRKIKEGSVK
ncbi:MAG: hypothetical protein Q8O28_01760 [Smithellaceae bacterium]|nr:hypothetical protein [Smithellaceae bacterium]